MDIATLPKGTPEHIVAGMVWMEPIANIRNKFSIDFAVPDDYYDRPEAYYVDSKGVKQRHRRITWDDLLDDKRNDDHYPDVVESIRESGWVRPVTIQLTGDGEVYRYGDGHHRLAVAIDLGMTHIPVEAVDEYGEPVSDDSGSWHKGRHIATSNACRISYTCEECWNSYSNEEERDECEYNDRRAEEEDED